MLNNAKTRHWQRQATDKLLTDDSLARVVDALVPIARRDAELQKQMFEALRAGDENRALALLREYLNLEDK